MGDVIPGRGARPCAEYASTHIPLRAYVLRGFHLHVTITTLPSSVSPLSLTETADIIGIIRDVAFIFILLLAIVTSLLLYRKVSALLDSVKRTVKSAEEISTALSDKIVRPAAAGSGVAFGAGKLAAFVLGLAKKRRGIGDRADG